MEYSVLLLVCAVLHLADLTEGMSIEKCDPESPLDIRENEENSITCRGFQANTTVTWWIFRLDHILFTIAECSTSKCTLYIPDQFTVQRSPQESHLVYRQQNRTEDNDAQIECETMLPDRFGMDRQRSRCKLNVISPAILSGCAMKGDKDKETVSGSCHFEHAFSAATNFTCSWFRTKSSDQSSTNYTGAITKDEYTYDGRMYWRGQCSLNITGQQWNDGDYSYSIDFYPGPGRRSVPVGCLAPPPAASDDEKGEKRVGIGIVFAAVGATLAVVIVGIIAFVVWLRRRQWILPCAGKETRVTSQRCSFRGPVEATGERRESQPEIYEIPDTPHGQQGNSRRTHLRDNSPTTESSQSTTGENSSTTVNNPPRTGDNSSENNYESLRSGDMGLRSVYSALPGPDYYNTRFSAGGTGVSTGPDVQASPIYEN